MKSISLLIIIVFATLPIAAKGQQGSKERIKVYSHALEGNLINDPANREVTVYLPPSYNSSSDRRYPVLYMLHGFTDDDSQWFCWEDHWINLHEVIDQSLAEGKSKEMIVVMPNAYNRFKGSMYSSSVTIGDWETFISQELVSHIDSNYRTIPRSESRGLAGHSMGGYGTLRLGMKIPYVWAAIYALSPCCMDLIWNNSSIESLERAAEIKSIEQLEPAPFSVMTVLASAAAWAPNPKNPPFYLDIPVVEGAIAEEISAKFTANRTLYTIEQYIPNLKKLKAIAIESGDKDGSISDATLKLHDLLLLNGVEHQYESYDGNHTNRIADRIRTKTLPYFSEHLVFE
jgi:enterochelin esterase-like enzyme